MSGSRPTPLSMVRRDLAHWRRATARLQVMLNTGAGGQVLAAEAPRLRRQCERMAADLQRLAQVSQAGRSASTSATQVRIAAPHAEPLPVQSGAAAAAPSTRTRSHPIA